MNKELIISSSGEVVKIAMLEEGRLMEFHQEKVNQRYNVGDIYLAKIKKLAPGMNAAFVTVGSEKDAFLHYHDLGAEVQSMLSYIKAVRSSKYKTHLLKDFPIEKEIDKNGKIEDVIQPGQNILVQIAKEPISTKGPRVTSEISIAGRYLVLVPFSDRVSVSQKIKEKTERDRLSMLVESIKPEGFGVIIRTVAEYKKVAELHQDLEDLVQKWKGIYNNLRAKKLPKRVHSELSRASGILRDKFSEDFVKIHCDDEELLEEIKDFLSIIAPGKEDILELYQKQTPILEFYNVEKQIKTSFGTHVNIPKSKGAYLVIEHTEALHVIDVNSGNIKAVKDTQEQNALNVNMQAGAEIARQLRLRDMGGIIVVDFIDMREVKNRRKFYDFFKEEMKKDGAKHKVLPPSKFGLVQITRQRVRPEVNIKTYEENPNKNGEEVEAPIAIIERIEARIKAIAEAGKAKKITIHMHPFVAAYLKQGIPSIRKKWAWKYRLPIKIMPRDSFRYLELHITDENQNEIYQESN
ncbi:Rne/Rng family ribonuclease [Ornithobacterium rhinotracheale]|uniref:Rne/Rng family ribonuclease n=1 Tax=Ornithobacterium rhinotracheale TaxID=28251 RepID=UPI00129C5158|nr:Rne/Rng family ribonuclease [Ornithobacterium rhinotracheale]MRJ07374.1 Rne/Rng family ribonuclease [Ornithobacterium rhinotracheale]UOH77971.1 Rne/Rng family ribonuclease [Ornithobacterium rhinotracheale]